MMTLRRRCLEILTILSAVAWAGEESPPKPKVDKTKVELQPIRTLDGAFKPYMDMEVPRAAEDDRSPAPSEKLRLAPGITGDVFKTPSARLTLTGQSHWEHDGDPVKDFRRARDSADARYRFDDGIAWTQWDRALRFEYQEHGSTRRILAEEYSALSAGQRFDLLDVSVYSKETYRYRLATAEPVPLRLEETDGVELKFTALEFFRPRMGLESSEVDRFGAGGRNRKLEDLSRDRISAGAEGRWNDWLNWKAGWQGWAAGDDWEPRVENTPAWDREQVDLNLQTKFTAMNTALGVNLKREEGYLRETVFREADAYGVSLRQPLGERLSARMGGDLVRRSDSNAETEHRTKAGLSADYRLHKRTMLGAGYEYSRVEIERPNAAAQFNEERAVKVEFKMKW